MKKFKFTLQTIHNVREMKQERETTILAALNAEMKEAQERVANLEARRLEAMDIYALKLTSGEALHPMEMELNANHFASLNRLQKEAESALEQKRTEFRLQSQRVAAAMREVKVTERLRTVQEERHQTEFQREEQNTSDELVATSFARRLIQTK